MLSGLFSPQMLADERRGWKLISAFICCPSAVLVLRRRGANWEKQMISNALDKGKSKI